MTDDITMRAWAYLSRVAEPPNVLLNHYVATVGPVTAAAEIKAGTSPVELADCVEARRGVDCAAEDLDILDRRGGRLITGDAQEWPFLSFTAFNGKEVRKRRGWVPLVLWAVGPGALDDVADRAAAIVGTRAATTYGEHVAADLAAGLAEHDVSVVSGGAYGIDAAAHRATLAADGMTVAVLAGGIDIPYPAGHAGLLGRIAESGLVLSEYPPGVRPARYRFLARNRLVAVLGGATVVVEAGLRSGAANTASWAHAMGRVACAVPGPVTSAASSGCHHLLRQGAQLVTRAAEVIEIVGRAGELAADPDRPRTALDGLTDQQRQVYEALPRRGVLTVEQISASSGLRVQSVLGPLAMLEIAGLAENREGRWGIARSVRG